MSAILPDMNAERLALSSRGATNVFISFICRHTTSLGVVIPSFCTVLVLQFMNNDMEGGIERKPIESSSFRKVLISACASLGFYCLSLSLTLATYSSFASFLRGDEKRICQSFLFSSLPSSAHWGAAERLNAAQKKITHITTRSADADSPQLYSGTKNRKRNE